MSLIHRRIRGQAIKITVSVHIPKPYSLPARQYNVERVVVVSPVAFLQPDIFAAVHDPLPFSLEKE
jgi:hypothetical protein